ncbi:hypothetical protein F4820DRAFT_444834 [Hypoxylon rubiginosum]|uniref:Uncharacterized protein n=1 Tax=Hypoxylon rubiginosum TaxID=110542 RepID=A0ACB9ZAK9_9PEZI|nr:hypothetical protein F4820DRAFT_444834 [Hypoxylon rubiginosum]
MPDPTSRGIIGERAAVLLAQYQQTKQQEQDAKRAKPSLAIPESASASEQPENGASKPDNGFQIQADRDQLVQVGLEGKKLTGRRRMDARVLDMQWKLDTYFVPRGAWIYMSKSYKEEEEKEEVFDWCAFDEESQKATF